VQLQLLARPTLLFDVSRHVFHPKPDVTSAVVALDFDAPDDLGVSVEKLRRTVRTAFNQRRKTLRNSLKPITSETGCDVPEDVAGRRPEALEPARFIPLARAIFGEDGG
jgi:16S rRNA (adenine1518-N6/adenine1519-N6)-dimethyltransferase